MILLTDRGVLHIRILLSLNIINGIGEICKQVPVDMQHIMQKEMLGAIFNFTCNTAIAIPVHCHFVEICILICYAGIELSLSAP
jgi:hypothetical protein